MPCKSYGALEGDRESAARPLEGGRAARRFVGRHLRAWRRSADTSWSCVVHKGLGFAEAQISRGASVPPICDKMDKMKKVQMDELRSQMQEMEVSSFGGDGLML